MNRNQLKAFFLSTTFLFYGLVPFEKAAANTIYVNCELKGLVSRNSRKKCLANEYLSENVPNYAKDVAPHVIDEVRFADFIRKYKEQRDFSEQEKLEAIVQLGIYKYAPKWLTPATKAMINKMLKSSPGQKAALLTKPIKIAMIDPISFATSRRMVSDISVSRSLVTQGILTPFELRLLFTALSEAELATIIAEIRTAIPILIDKITPYIPDGIVIIVIALKEICNRPNVTCTYETQEEIEVYHRKEPGQPTENDGYTPPKNWDGKLVPNPNGPGYGYPDNKGNVWVPTGVGGSQPGTNGPAHGGAHWDVQTPGRGSVSVYPGGKVRGSISPLQINNIHEVATIVSKKYETIRG